MGKYDKINSGQCCGLPVTTPENSFTPFMVEAIVTMDARGQIVLPKDVRDKLSFKSGDKLAVVSHISGNDYCCLSLMKADVFLESVHKILGPGFQLKETE